jgi:DNA-binding GntR family transcriptional regulator
VEKKISVKAELKELDLEPLKNLAQRKSLGQHVFENLKLAIINGDLAPGKWLVESRIADALGISRTPVREAIHKLEREGLIRKLPRGGFTVLGLTREDIEETFGIRCVLESYAASLAALKYQEKEIKPLEKKIEEFQKNLDRGHLDVLPMINTEFHDLLYALSRSPKLIKMINGLRDQISRFRQIILKKENMAQTSNRDHRLMLESIRKRDAEGVERLVREHILRGQAAVLEALDNQQKNKEF